MKKVILSLLAASMVLCSACTVGIPHSAVQGSLSDITKEGRAECKTVLGFTSGDCSIATAAKNGDINEIIIVDQEIHNYFFVVKTETIVYGR